MKYSLSKYILTISIGPQVAALYGTPTIELGGQGSYTEFINVEQTSDQWSLAGDATGGYTFNKSNDRTGTAQISLNQLSVKVAQLKTLCNIYYTSEEIEEGLTITVKALNGTTVATCEDCLIKKIPAQNMGATAANQTWDFLCGKVTFH